jgi:hypothetical protein
VILSQPVRRRRATSLALSTSSGREAPSVLPDTSPRFADFLTEFRQDFGGWSPVTWRGLSGVLRGIDGEFGEQHLSEITPRPIDRYLSRRRRENGGLVGHMHPPSAHFCHPPTRQGTTTRSRMELLGHSSYQMVLRFAKARPPQLVEAVKSLDQDTAEESTRGASAPSSQQVGNFHTDPRITR